MSDKFAAMLVVSVMMHEADNPIRWSTAPSFGATCDEVARRLAEWTRNDEPTNADISVVKQGPHRRVLRMAVDGQVVFLKQQPAASLVKRLQLLVRRSSCEREFIAYQRLRMLGIPTPLPMAWGQQRSSKRVTSYLLTSELCDAVPLDVLTTDADHPLTKAIGESSLLRRVLIAKLAMLTARLHHAGLLHTDYHAGNLLAVWNEASVEDVELFLIDLAPIKSISQLTTKQRLQNIAVLFHTFAQLVRPADAARFWRDYQAALSELGEAAASSVELRGLVRDANSVVIRHQEIAYQKADRKWERGNRRLVIRRQGAYNARGLADLKSQGLVELLTEPNQLLANVTDADYRKRSTSRFVVKTTWPSRESGPIFVKRIQSPRLRHWGCILSGIFTKTRRTWEFGHAMLRRGISTPKPLMFVERPVSKSLFSPVEETLVTQEAIGLVPLAPFVKHVLSSQTSEVQRDWRLRYAKLLGRELAKFHHARFDHRDLKAMNILVAEDVHQTSYTILDLDAVRRWNVLPTVLRNKNLARIVSSLMEVSTVSPSDALRGLVAYRRMTRRLALAEIESGRDDTGWKSQWRETAKLVDGYQSRKFKPPRLTTKSSSVVTMSTHRKAA
ncbi:lipopolysaccharide kinase InaA family protein [Lacunimicrobium album]